MKGVSAICTPGWGVGVFSGSARFGGWWVRARAGGWGRVTLPRLTLPQLTLPRFPLARFTLPSLTLLGLNPPYTDPFQTYPSPIPNPSRAHPSQGGPSWANPFRANPSQANPSQGGLPCVHHLGGKIAPPLAPALGCLDTASCPRVKGALSHVNGIDGISKAWLEL